MEVDRCCVEDEPVRAQVATLTSALDPDLREQVADHSSVDLDDREVTATLTVQQVLDMVGNFFDASADHNTAMIQLLRFKQADGEAAGHFLARIKRQAKYTAFATAPAQWRDHLVLGVLLNGLRDDVARDKVGREEGRHDAVTQAECVDRLRELEANCKRKSDLKSKIAVPAAAVHDDAFDEDVNKVSAYAAAKKRPDKTGQPKPHEPKQDQTRKLMTCSFCSKTGHVAEKCFKRLREAKKEAKADSGAVFIVSSAEAIHGPRTAAPVGELCRRDVGCGGGPRGAPRWPGRSIRLWQILARQSICCQPRISGI